jgi:hypothetical protein
MTFCEYVHFLKFILNQQSFGWFGFLNWSFSSCSLTLKIIILLFNVHLLVGGVECQI